MASMAFNNYKRKLSSPAFTHQEQRGCCSKEEETTKTVGRKWSCDEDGVHISAMWLPLPRWLIN